MAIYPKYQDFLNHDQFGKSNLPLLIIRSLHQNNYPLHYHNFAELSLVVEGSGTEILNGKRHRFKRGTVSFLLPHHIHEIRVETPYVQKYNCMFDMNILFLSPTDHELANTLMKVGEEFPANFDLDEEQTVHMINVLESMAREYENPQFAADSVLRSKLLEAFIYLLRTCRYHAYPQIHYTPRDMQENILEILNYLHVSYQEEISLTSLASRFNRNPSYMSRIFKQYVGITFTDYLHSLRVGRAASLLVTTSMSVTDIAVEVGFEQTRTFTRVFKELKGMTPKHFRAARRQFAAGESNSS